MVVKNTQGNVICINCIPPDELKSLVEAKCLKYIGKKNPSQQEMLTGKIPDFKTMGEFTMAIASHQAYIDKVEGFCEDLTTEICKKNNQKGRKTLKTLDLM